jgi:hypothetical protein
MVARHGFMRRQRRQFPQRPLVEVGGIDEVGAGNPSVRTAGNIVSGCVALGGLGRNFLHAIRKARKTAEQGRHLAVEDLCLERGRLH